MANRMNHNRPRRGYAGAGAGARVGAISPYQFRKFTKSGPDIANPGAEYRNEKAKEYDQLHGDSAHERRQARRARLREAREGGDDGPPT